MSELVFDPESHTYRWRGRAVPSVTQVLKETGLIDDQWFTDRSRDIGRAVHLATEYSDRGILLADSVSPLIEGYLRAWRRFRAELPFEFAEVEERVYHQSAQYAGTLDRLAVHPDGSRWVLDIKTGAPADWHRWQLAAYAMALENPRAHRRARVQLKADGSYRLTEYPLETLGADYNVFHCARFVWNYQARRAA